jgi:hypothetical protein
MKKEVLLLWILIGLSCASTTQQRIPQYFDLINQAELLICTGDYPSASATYRSAFECIDQPFGKDLFNAALVCQLAGLEKERDEYLQTILDHAEEVGFVKDLMIGDFLSEEEWNLLMKNRKTRYNVSLLKEFKEINYRDQAFRPDYDQYDDTINANRKINMGIILDYMERDGFPAQQELGYGEGLVNLPHHVVLHHTAQRRSRDKSVIDLEPILWEAVQQGRFDPEKAIYFMNFQQDPEKGRFEPYAIWRYEHPLLPDSLNERQWLPKLSPTEKEEANQMRSKWHANSLEEITQKAQCLSDLKLPFIFTSVSTAVARLDPTFSAEEAYEQYSFLPSFREALVPKP